MIVVYSMEYIAWLGLGTMHGDCVAGVRAVAVTAKSRLKLTHFFVCAHDTVRVHGRVFVVIRTPGRRTIQSTISRRTLCLVRKEPAIRFAFALLETGL